jgi:hypothetical protein
LITRSYEARAAGVKTGMRIYEARRLCPGLIQRPARPRVYAGIATRIMHGLRDISPDVEVFSVDEAFVEVTHCQRLHGSPEHIALLIRRRVHEVSGGLPRFHRRRRKQIHRQDRLGHEKARWPDGDPAADARALNRFSAVDRINTRHGEFTVAPAILLERSTMPNVIAPAWRPQGHRQHMRD